MAKPITLLQSKTEKDAVGSRVKYIINKDVLKQWTANPDLNQLHVAVISVTGKPREGKSFLTNFLLRYAAFRYGSNPHDSDQGWIGQLTEPFPEGFPIQLFKHRKTSTIDVWPAIFKTKSKSGEMIGIIIMETQGEYGTSDSTCIYSLSTLMSSLQIYNFMLNLREQQLQRLELSTAYAKAAARLTSTDKDEFQNLILLTRDFRYVMMYGLGTKGGQKYVYDQIERLYNPSIWDALTKNHHRDHIEVRRNIAGSFEKMNGCCLPDPGRKIAENVTDKIPGTLRDLEPTFKVELAAFVTEIMSPNNLVLKRINGDLVTLKQLLYHLIDWVGVFNSDRLSMPKPLYQQMVIRSSLEAMEEAMDIYNAKMESIGCLGRDHVKQRKLEDAHGDAIDKAVEHLMKHTVNVWSHQQAIESKQKLETSIMRRFNELMDANNAKNELTNVSVPLFCLFGMFLCVITSAILDAFWKELGLTYIVNLFRIVLVVIVCFWVKETATDLAQHWWTHSLLRSLYYQCKTVLEFLAEIFRYFKR